MKKIKVPRVRGSKRDKHWPNWIVTKYNPSLNIRLWRWQDSYSIYAFTTNSVKRQRLHGL